MDEYKYEMCQEAEKQQENGKTYCLGMEVETTGEIIPECKMCDQHIFRYWDTLGEGMKN